MIDLHTEDPDVLEAITRTFRPHAPAGIDNFELHNITLNTAQNNMSDCFKIGARTYHIFPRRSLTDDRRHAHLSRGVSPVVRQCIR